MISPKRAVSRSLFAGTDAETNATRVGEIRAVDNPVKRLGLQLAHDAVLAHPAVAAKFVGIELLEPLGSGYQSRVYRVGPREVLKVDKGSRLLTAYQRREKATRMRYEHEALVSELGPRVIPHEVELGPDPLYPASETIRIVQEYRDLEFIDLLHGSAKTIARRLKLARAKYADVAQDVGELLSGSRSLDATYNLSTDLEGRNNVGFDIASGHVVVIDAQPVNDEHPGVQQLINRGLNTLGVALGRL